MDPRLWQEDYRREVEQVLEEMRSAKGVPEREAAFEGIIPSAGFASELKSYKEQAAKLSAELKAKEELVAEELRKRDALKDLVVKLNAHVLALQRQSELSQAQAEREGAKARELLDKLQAAEERAAQAAATAESQRSSAQVRFGEVRALQARLDELQLALDAESRRAVTFQARFESLSRDLAEQAQRRESEMSEAARQAETAKAELSRVAARLTAQTESQARALDAARAEAVRCREEAVALEARLGQATSDLQALKGALDEESHRGRRELTRVDEALRLEAARRQESDDRLRQARERLEAAEGHRARLEAELAETRRRLSDSESACARTREEAARTESEAARRSLEASRQLQALRAQVQEEAAEVARRAQDAERLREEADRALTLAAQARAQALESLARGAAQRKQLEAAFESERQRLLEHIDEKRAEAEAQAEARVAELRQRLKTRWDADTLGESERERLRLQQEEERARILSQAREQIRPTEGRGANG